MDIVAEQLVKISDTLFLKKRAWDQLCQEIAINSYPLRADFVNNFNLGDDFATGVVDGFTINARETLGNALDSMLRQGQWFQAGTGDVDRDKKSDNASALSYTTKKLMGAVLDRRVRFAPATKEADHDWVAFGNPVLSVEVSDTRLYPVIKAHHPKDCAWMVNDEGKVTAMFRKIRMTARTVKRKFDTQTWTGTLNSKIVEDCEKDPSSTVDIRHILIPVEEVYGYDPKKMRELRHQYLSLYINMTHKEILNERGSRIFNYLVPRWRTVSNFAQGFSPAAINSLPDGRMLQELARIILEQGEKSIDPPMIGSGEMFTRDLNLYAGGMTYVDMPEGADLRSHLTTLQTGAGLPLGLQLKQDVRNLISEAFMLNKLFLPNMQQMTAYEASVRTEEFRRAALPFFTPIKSEYHQELLGVLFDVMCNMGQIDAAVFPDDLHGVNIAFEFQSPLEEAEGAAVVSTFQKSMAIIAASSQVDQQIANIFDLHTMTTDAVTGAGAPPEWTLSGPALAAQKAQDRAKKDAMDTALALRNAAAVATEVSGASQAATQAGLVQPPGAGMPGGPGGAMPGGGMSPQPGTMQQAA